MRKIILIKMMLPQQPQGAIIFRAYILILLFAIGLLFEFLITVSVGLVSRLKKKIEGEGDFLNKLLIKA